MLTFKKLFESVVHLTLIFHCAAFKANKTPPGYYAFEKAMKINGMPPRVRKPPYVPADIPCPGAVKSDFYHSPRDTLCGDLNRGFVPLNPMKQAVTGQPYPFEIIKNKTLYYLAQSLPFLKKDINSIPKVAKLASMSFSPDHQLHKRSVNNATSKSSYLESILNYTETRQKACDGHKDGVLCQLIQALSGGQTANPILNSINQAANVLTAAHSAANTAQSLGSIASLIHQYSNGNGVTNTAPWQTTNGDHNNKSILSQILSFVSSLNGNSQSTSNFSPLTAIVEYFSSGSSPIPSSLLPARRKKPLELEDVASEQVVEQIPPTPCPSIEEYVAPVFARNYQGVWKYVVQIPHEGYFTQTVQKTACVKSRCDFLEGVCHESPRWVSLLVAEIYYPQTHFPNVVASASIAKPHSLDIRHPPVPPASVVNHLSELPVSDELFEQFLNHYRSNDVPNDNTLIKPRFVRKKRQPVKEEKESRKNAVEEEKCDGYDKLGCYVVRVYHDWFLVPGSCKCWKKSTQSSLDTIKKIFIGK